MVVTKKEATQKLCPFAKSFNASRTRLIEPEAYERVQTAERPQCIADQCMAWDWIDPEMEVRSVYCSTRSSQSGYWECNKAGDGLASFVPEDIETGGWSFRSYVPSSSFDSRSGNIYIQRPHPNRHGRCQRTVTIGEE